MDKKEKPSKYKPKMRITYLSPKGVTLKDRLVDQGSELQLGPQESHSGPIRLEFTVHYKEDMEMISTYLAMVAGKIPLKERKVYKSKPKDIVYEEPIDELLADIKRIHINTDETNQEKLIQYMRDHGFSMLTYQAIKDFKLPIAVKKSHRKWAFLVRRIKEGKNPKADKYDPQLAIGIRLSGQKENHVLVYLYSKFTEKLDCNWPNKIGINYKKLKATIFPPYMPLGEREKYRAEERKLQLNPDAKPSKFFSRWKHYIEELNKKKFIK